MVIADYLNRDFVLAALTAGTKSDVLRELVAPLAGQVDGVDPEQAFQVLLDREQLGTTGIGDGIAIPHGKLRTLERIVVVVGRSIQGVDFEALDYAPCHIFFLVLAPEQVAGMHLRVLAQISRTLKDEAFRRHFMAANGRDGLWSLLSGV